MIPGSHAAAPEILQDRNNCRQIRLYHVNQADEKGETVMKYVHISFILGLILVAGSSLALADPPFGVGSATVITDPDAVWWVAWVDLSGQSVPVLPGGEGLVLVQLEDVHLVYSNDPDGNIHLRAHGRLPLGGSVMAFDTFGGGFVLATLAEVEDACAALSPVFPEACRGNNAMVLLNSDTTGLTCEINGFQSEQWRTTTTRNGITNSTCHVFP